MDARGVRVGVLRAVSASVQSQWRAARVGGRQGAAEGSAESEGNVKHCRSEGCACGRCASTPATALSLPTTAACSLLAGRRLQALQALHALPGLDVALALPALTSQRLTLPRTSECAGSPQCVPARLGARGRGTTEPRRVLTRHRRGQQPLRCSRAWRQRATTSRGEQ